MALPLMPSMLDVVHAAAHDRLAKAHSDGVPCAKIAPGFYEFFKIDMRRLTRMGAPFVRIRRLVDVTVGKLRRRSAAPLYANESESRPVVVLPPVYEQGSIDRLVVGLVVEPPHAR